MCVVLYRNRNHATSTAAARRHPRHAIVGFWRSMRQNRGMDSLPTLFLSHGSPMLALDDNPARRFLLGLGAMLPRPQAILVVSAHWETLGVPAVGFAPQPETIHDFGGFPQALFDLQYPAPGAPDIAGTAFRLLTEAGFAPHRSALRGLDHGAWVPLRLMYPDAAIPTLQVSLVRGGSAADHYRMGQALSPLRGLGVLMVGSGSLTHNLAEVWGRDEQAPTPAWVHDFETWMSDRLLAGQREALLHYRTRAPHAIQNHPTEEHLLPLFVAWGASDPGGTVQHLHQSYTYGVLAMDAYAFAPQP